MRRGRGVSMRAWQINVDYKRVGDQYEVIGTVVICPLGVRAHSGYAPFRSVQECLDTVLAMHGPVVERLEIQP